MRNRTSCGRRSGNTVLVEVLVGLVLSSMLVAMTGSLWLYGIRNFGAVANNTELEAKSRNGLVFRSRNLRPASPVTGFQARVHPLA